MHTRTRLAARAVAAFAAAFALTGCLTVDAAVDHRSDGSGTAQASIWVSSDINATIDETQIEEYLPSSFGADAAERIDVTVDTTVDGTTTNITFDYRDPDELAAVLTHGDIGVDQLLERFALTQTDTGWNLTATSALNPDNGHVMGSADNLEGYTAEFTITLPGTIGDSNADTVNGNTATWDLTTGDGTLTAQSNNTGTSSTRNNDTLQGALIALAALTIISVAAAIIITHSRRARPPGDTPNATPLELPEPGWYTDPNNPTRARWWDGTTWRDGAQP